MGWAGCWVGSRHHAEVTCGGGNSAPAVRAVVGLGSWSVQGGLGGSWGWGGMGGEGEMKGMLGLSRRGKGAEAGVEKCFLNLTVK